MESGPGKLSGRNTNIITLVSFYKPDVGFFSFLLRWRGRTEGEMAGGMRDERTGERGMERAEGKRGEWVGGQR